MYNISRNLYPDRRRALFTDMKQGLTVFRRELTKFMTTKFDSGEQSTRAAGFVLGMERALGLTAREYNEEVHLALKRIETSKVRKMRRNRKKKAAS